MNDEITEAKKEIANAAKEATGVIANAANEASKLIITASEAAAKVLTMEHRVDHDILITLVGKVDGLKDDIKGIKNDHETRLRNVEVKVTKIMTYGTAALLVIGLVHFLIQILINKFLHHGA